MIKSTNKIIESKSKLIEIEIWFDTKFGQLYGVLKCEEILYSHLTLKD